ncbi:MAG: type II toxin-antitoxin system RelE/ParE family toxin [Microcoleaceae cyanobacterium]
MDDLKAVPGLEVEELKADRVGQHAIKLSKGYRICFTWTADGAIDVEIVNYHKG